MKRLLKPMLFLLLAVFMINCEDDVKEGAKIDGLQGQATIRGLVLINNDQTTEDTVLFEPAANAHIRVYYYAADMSYTTDYSPDYVIAIETTTNADGEFSVNVPTIATGVDFYIEADQYHTSISYDDESTDAYFPKQTESVNLKINEETMVVLNYGSNPEIEL